MTRKIDYISISQQYSQLRSEILERLDDIFQTGQFILGDHVEKFESEFARYINVSECVSVSSGTAALALAMRTLGISHGDEVIVPANSFLATAGAVVEVGAIPVFADVAEDMNIDPSEIERLATPKTRAIIAVHLTGRPAPMDHIMAIADSKNIHVIEDCAQAVGAQVNGRYVGTIGDMGCFSFHPLKTLNCAGDGGAVTTNSAQWAGKLRILRNHGLKDRDHCQAWGTNARLDAIQAAILSINLSNLQEWTETRVNNAIRYNNSLKDIVKAPIPADNTRSVYHTYVIQADRRDELQKKLAQANIETKIHYPIPIHKQQSAGQQSKLPQCELQSRQILSLPVHQYLTADDIDYVSNAVIDFYHA